MIVPMKKISLICRREDRDRSLDALQALGVMHLVPVVPPHSADLDQAITRLRHTQSVLAALRACRTTDHGSRAAGASALEADRLVDTVRGLLEQKDERTGRLALLTAELAALKPYGPFDPEAIRSLARRGIVVRLYRVAGRKPGAAPEGTVVQVISRDRRGLYVAVAGRAPFEFNGEELTLPQRSPAEISAEAETITAALRDIKGALKDLSRDADAVAARAKSIQDEVQCLAAAAGMGGDGSILYLQGYCPVNAVDRIRRSAAEHGWGLVISDPGPDDTVPTLIRNPAWVRPVQSLFGLLDILPGYREVDIRPVFMLFFTLFFAILVGDAGYGLIFLLLVPVLRAKFRNAPREPLRLLLILSLATIAWGALSGCWFGVEPLPAPLRRLEFPWMKNDHNLMLFSFFAGAVHLTVAHAWRAIQTMPSTRALAQVGWICVTWMMFFVARHLIIGSPMSTSALVLGGVGLALLILFMTPFKHLKTEWADHAMLPFSVIGDFSDLVSYVRLFAVGSAGLALAVAVNELALGPGVESVGDAVRAALILAVGHIGNIVLCLMSVLVHGVRLNTLEFSGHIGLEWTGQKYRPFARSGEGDVETA